jgi:two-component sensor histidine kinase
MSLADRFRGLPTAGKLLLILSAVLLPIGIALMWMSESGIREANAALKGRSEDQSRAAAEAMQILVARNAMALRIASNGALAAGPQAACDRATRALSVAPGVAQTFELETADAQPICAAGSVGETGTLPVVAPGSMSVRIAPELDAVAVRVGVIDGMATVLVPIAEFRKAAIDAPGDIQGIALHDGIRQVVLLDPRNPSAPGIHVTDVPVGDGELHARIATSDLRLTAYDRLVLLLPLLMWIAAALITWTVVSRVLVRPLRRLETAVRRYEPGQELDLPQKLGPAAEIQELRDAFARAVARVDESDAESAAALDGQRRLVREVHHRVKNNLQVVASLLNIHGRSANTPEARFAYAGISRRVGALSIVHRNHFAEMEETRGIALRPLITELAAELRASAPESARALSIDLEVETANTTQDVAVAVAFLVTEIVEFSMLNCPADPIEIALRRTSELTARLTIASAVLMPEEDGSAEKVQFERIVAGLARQLRSPLERNLGRYSVDLPVFPNIG